MGEVIFKKKKKKKKGGGKCYVGPGKKRKDPKCLALKGAEMRLECPISISYFCLKISVT